MKDRNKECPFCNKVHRSRSMACKCMVKVRNLKGYLDLSNNKTTKEADEAKWMMGKMNKYFEYMEW